MAVKYLTQPYVQDDGTVIHFVIADEEAEAPSSPVGSYCFTKDTNKLWVRNSSNSWQEVGGGGGAHPDLATHVALGLTDDQHSHTHNHDGTYATSGHNHDAAYSAIGHSHGGGGGEAFPVGSVFISVVSTNPATLLGYGTWSAFGAGRTLVGIDAGQTEFDTVEETGGAKTHTLTEAEMPSHTHVQNAPTSASGGSVRFATDTNANGSTASGSTDATGGGGAHNNLQPYIVVYMWKRTA